MRPKTNNNSSNTISIKSSSFIFNTNSTDNTSKFIQLYPEGMSALNNLKTYGLIMLNYIYRNIGFGCNWIVLNQTKISEELSVSQPRISDGIRQLIDANFIAKAINDKNNVYIINHNMMFMGDRNKFISDYMRLYSDK